MGNNLDKIMQKSIISENFNLSKMIEDIVPIKDQQYTNVELEANKKEEFSLVVYQKQTVFTKFLRAISISLEKIKIIRNLSKYKVPKVSNEN